MIRGPSLYCNRPLEHMEIVPDGKVYLCCSGWLPVSVGNILESSIQELWTNAESEKIRHSTSPEGDFRHCGNCPYLQNMTGPVVAGQPRTNRPAPKYINLAYDRTCNLSCPSCRRDVFVIGGERKDVAQRITDKLLTDPSFSEVEEIWVTGSGDPFASSIYRTLLRTLPEALKPLVALHTNGLLFREGWETLPYAIKARVRRVDVSVDAATETTYAINRRGGKWGDLLKALDFIKRLNRTDIDFRLSFVVQENNFLEMVDFVQLGLHFGADRISFKPIRNWGTFTEADFKTRTVHKSDHPRHSEYLAVIADPIFKTANVELSPF